MSHPKDRSEAEEGEALDAEGRQPLVLSPTLRFSLPPVPNISDLPPENWSGENESPRGWGNAPRRTPCAGAGLRRSRSSAC